MKNALKAARQAAGKTQAELGSEARIAQSDESKYESGEKLMPKDVASRLARHLPGTTASELLLSNKVTAFKRAQERGDRLGVLKACESIVKYAESLPADPQLDDMLDNLVRKAAGLAEGSEDPQSYADGLAAEGRDILGVRKRRFLPDEEEHTYPKGKTDTTFYPLHPGHRDTVLPVEEGTTDDHFGGDVEEDYDDVDDGRDAFGVRVRPLGE